ncbi:TPA: N-acetyltransferase [Candidatus Poribacteria bacterium]|nr:N-acetyltransferase [Candidatus Poribacteria bacterium]
MTFWKRCQNTYWNRSRGMSIRLRSETSGDEEAIDIVNCRAFGEMDEANLVRLLRTYYPAFDRRYSITAWDDEQLVGHALFTPAQIRLMGKTVKALAVGPVAVLPESQRTGIGGELLRRGHELGKRDGFRLTFLLGHPEYYPRHGYKACFGFARVTIDTENLPPATQKFHRSPVQLADVPWLVERYAAEWAEVDFGWLWGMNLNEWTIPCVSAMLWWTEDGRRAAYTLAKSGGWPQESKWKMMLAEDPMLAREVISTIKPKTLEHHPSGWLAKNVLDPKWGTAEVNASRAAMACELEEGILQPYLQALESNEHLPGFCNWPLPFMLC